jgi:hypothetical protein
MKKYLPAPPQFCAWMKIDPPDPPPAPDSCPIASSAPSVVRFCATMVITPPPKPPMVPVHKELIRCVEKVLKKQFKKKYKNRTRKKTPRESPKSLPSLALY